MSARLLLAVVWVAAAPVGAQPFESSNLPIVLIDTDGVEIPDEPKIPGRMQVIDNGTDARNHITDPANGYDGHIGIETRGSSSQGFAKKQYGLETRDADGENNNVELLGLPEENDWILYAPYSDKSLMRNVLLYDLARDAGRYASRRRFVEVVLNGDYAGLYVLLEKVKRDDNRVDINKLKPDETAGDDLTGGYIVEIDRYDGPSSGWYPGFPTVSGWGDAFYTYNTPGADDIVPEQRAYIQSAFDDLRDTLESPDRDDPDSGYRSLVDLGSFVDFVIWQELSRNVDGYRLSTYLHKDKDSENPRIHAGPVWDFNLAFGNANYMGGSDISGFQIDFPYGETYPVSLWWRQMFETTSFQQALQARWTELRAGLLSDAALEARIDAIAAEVDEAQARNFDRWPVLGVYVWPNAYVGETYADEVRYLKEVVVARAAWLDANWPYAVSEEGGPRQSRLSLSPARPNPARGRASVTLTSLRTETVRVDLVDMTGRVLARVFDGVVSPSVARDLSVPTSGVAPGVYVLRAQSGDATTTRRISVLR